MCIGSREAHETNRFSMSAYEDWFSETRLKFLDYVMPTLDPLITQDHLIVLDH